MSIGFGFSVGDFLAALRLVGTVIDALRSSAHASTEYRALLNELLHLETALLHVKRLELDSSQNAERIALQQAAAQCQRTIDDFFKATQKYQGHLLGTGSRLKDGWMKLKWTLCRKDDIDKFRADLRGHTSSIEILLVTAQMKLTSLRAREEEKRGKTLAGKIQELSCQWMGKLSVISNGVAESVQQGKQLLESTAKVIETNLRVFQMVFDIQQFILKLPAQVNRQQPVYMIDAFGKESPFHLEFVRSAEALKAVLKVNFKASGCGPRMIDRGEFAIQRAGSCNDVDLTGVWETCFLPGDRVSMDMIFKTQTAGVSCPSCGTESANVTDRETTCIICGTVFRRITEVFNTMQPPLLPAVQQERVRTYGTTQGVPESSGPKRERDEEDNIDTQIKKFRRIRLKSTEKENRCVLYELMNGVWRHRGTGYASVRDVDGVMWLEVEDEDEEGRYILMERFDHVFRYQTQHDTLIVCTELDEDERVPTDMGLSFEDPSDCTRIWDHLLRYSV